MSLTPCHGAFTRAFGSLLFCGLVCGTAFSQAYMQPEPKNTQANGWATSGGHKSNRLPLARLIRNPDESGTGPKYALADQAGNIQRYVEPVPGIDLDPYVGYAV